MQQQMKTIQVLQDRLQCKDTELKQTRDELIQAQLDIRSAHQQLRHVQDQFGDISFAHENATFE